MGPWSDMANRILILTEGSVDEQDVFFSAFNKYGIDAIAYLNESLKLTQLSLSNLAIPVETQRFL